MHPQHVAVGALELGVDVHERLHPVVARRKVRHVGDRRAEIVAVDRRRRAGRKLLDVAPEERRADAADLQPRLARAVVREDHVDATGQLLAAHRRRHADLEL